MSFAGHVFDMIRRNKEDREMLKQLRGRGKDARRKYTSSIPDITADEFDKINQQLKKREQQERSYIFRTKLLIISIAILLLLVFGIIKIVLF